MTALVLLVLSTSAQVAFARPVSQDDDLPGTTVQKASSSRLAVAPRASALKSDQFTSYVPPQETLLNSIARQNLGPNATQVQIELASKQYLAEWRKTAYHGPDAEAYEQLQRNEQRALAANSSPEAMGLGVEGTLRLFTVAVEFNGTDGADDFSHPINRDSTECITDTVSFTGPLHNEIPPPGPRDNFSNWRADFNRDYYEKLVLSETGITERTRPDLIDPEDGLPGIDLSGLSMRNYYEEVSGGRVQFDTGPAGVIAWLQVPHSQGYYAANSCIDGEYGRIQQMNGLPQNPRFPNGVDQLLIDIVDKINDDAAASGTPFPWKDYDTNGDGVIDHVVMFHAGKDRSAGGGKEGYQAIWAHRGRVDQGGALADDRGTADPADDIRLVGYTAQYEDVETGVLVHEFGHDLGLPDLYDTSGQGESSVVWWDLMSTGSNTGKLIGTTPTHMSAWSKYALGWANPRVITPTADLQNVTLGQTSNPPAGTDQAVRVNLPSSVVTNTVLLPGSTQAWWTNNDANWTDSRLTRDVNLVGQTAPISISYYLDGAAEEDWDYMFLEVSTDNGATYTQLKGFEVGSDVELTTPDDYSDPNGNLANFGNLKHGFTGDISALASAPIEVADGAGIWVHVYHDLSAYNGQNLKLRFRYTTDAAFVERGYFVDNIKIVSKSATILDDPVEANNANGWVLTVAKFDPNEPLGAGWQLSNGLQLLPQYYLLEWRNFDGFDKGLKYTYNTVFADQDEFRVDLVPSNVPGMVVWHRDTRYGNEPFGADNSVFNHFFDTPSEGPKGGLMVIDANPMPIRGPRNGRVTTTQGTFPFAPLNNWNGRVQTTNAAFNLQGSPAITLNTSSTVGETTTYTPTTYTSLPSVTGFHDALGYYPGVEQLAVPVVSLPGRARIYAYTDPDASSVVPAKGYYPPRTPAGFTGQTQGADVSFFETMWLTGGGVFNTNVGDVIGENVTGQHSGNPGSGDLQYGYHFEVTNQAANGSTGTIRLYNSKEAGAINATVLPDTTAGQVTVTVNWQNNGSPADTALYSDFDETQVSYVEGSATNGAIPVRASLAQVQQIVRTQGIRGLAQVQVQPGEATAVVKTVSPLDTGATLGFSYKLVRKPGSAGIQVINTVTYGSSSSFSSSTRAQLGTFLYLPLISK